MLLSVIISLNQVVLRATIKVFMLTIFNSLFRSFNSFHLGQGVKRVSKNFSNFGEIRFVVALSNSTITLACPVR